MITLTKQACPRPLFSFFLLLSLFVGCQSEKPNLDESVKFLGMTYFNYQQIWNRPPANWDEILTLAAGDGLEPDRKMLNQVQSSDYVILWNVDCQDPAAQTRVLAYRTSSLTNGGSVLFADGSLRNLTAVELADCLEKADRVGDRSE